MPYGGELSGPSEAIPDQPTTSQPSNQNQQCYQMATYT